MPESPESSVDPTLSPRDEATRATTRRGRASRRNILARAAQIASREGLEALTIGSLAKELGMSKSGLYGHFGSKEELQLATVDEAARVWNEAILPAARAMEEGLPRLRGLLEAWITSIEMEVFEGGCFFASASAEFDGRPGSVRDRLAELHREWLEALEAEVVHAQEKRQIRSEPDTGQLAFELHAYVLGANQEWGLGDRKTAVHRARDAVLDRLRQAATNTGLKVLYASTSVPVWKAVTGRPGRGEGEEDARLKDGEASVSD